MGALLFVVHQSNDTSSGLELRMVYEPYVVLTDNCIRLKYESASIQLSNDDPEIVRTYPRVFIDRLLDDIICEDIHHIVFAIEFHKRNKYKDSKCKVIDPKRDKELYNRVKEYKLDKLRNSDMYDPNMFYKEALGGMFVNSNIDTFWGLKGRSRKKS